MKRILALFLLLLLAGCRMMNTTVPTVPAAAASVSQYVNENVEEAAALVEQYIGVAAGVAKKAIPACNIVCMTGEEMKAAAEKYLTVLFELNPDAVGGAMPEESFYYLP